MRITDPKQLNKLLHRKTTTGTTVQQEIESARKKNKPSQTDGEFKKAKAAVQKGYDAEIVLMFFKEHKLPVATPEFRFHPERLYKFDFAFQEQMVALEVEGGVFKGGGHTSIKGFLKDIHKYNLATVMGWRVLRVVPSELCMQETIDMLKEILK